MYGAASAHYTQSTISASVDLRFFLCMSAHISRASDLTALLRSWSEGSPTALHQLTAEIYDDLRRLARIYMSNERADHTLQPTALVHETFLRLLAQRGVRWQDRGHFLAVAATQMKRLLLQHARSKRAAKRHPGQPLLRLDQVAELSDDVASSSTSMNAEIVEAIERLAELDPRQGRVVELRILLGLTEEEISRAVGVSLATVKRDWRLAKAWLRREMAPQEPSRGRALGTPRGTPLEAR